jgi:hypothetical protein
VLFALGLVSACTCGYTAGITNETDAPVFANISSDWEGQRWEEEGVLIPPHSRTELTWSFDAFLRIRDMSGNTIAFRYLPEGEDVSLVVSSLEPLPDPDPLGVPWWTGSEGLSTTWSRIICRNGQKEKVPEFWMTITVRSDFDGPLIVSAFEPSSDRNDPDDGGELLGVLVPPLGEARLHLDVVEQGWIRAYEPQSRLIFTKAVPREPLPVVTIPASLPPEPDPIPTLDFSWRMGFGMSCGGASDSTLTLVGAGAAAAAVAFFGAVLAGAAWWASRRRTGPG